MQRLRTALDPVEVSLQTLPAPLVERMIAKGGRGTWTARDAVICWRFCVVWGWRRAGWICGYPQTI